jgi:hypothetical protein
MLLTDIILHDLHFLLHRLSHVNLLDLTTSWLAARDECYF